MSETMPTHTHPCNCDEDEDEDKHSDLQPHENCPFCYGSGDVVWDSWDRLDTGIYDCGKCKAQDVSCTVYDDGIFGNKRICETCYRAWHDKAWPACKVWNQ